MSKKVFLDLETVPPAEDLRAGLKPEFVRKLQARQSWRTQRESAGGTTGGAANAQCAGGCTEEQFRSLALYAEYGRILCVGLIIEEGGEVLHQGALGRERSTGEFHLDEARTLRAFWKLVAGFNTGRDLIIGHNVMDFDLPFLYKRSRINQVRPSVFVSFARYRSAPVYDTMREWAHWNPQEARISLPELAEVLRTGMTKTEGMDGGRVYDEMLAGNHERIARYCLRDVEMARAVYYRMCYEAVPEVGLIQERRMEEMVPKV
jgi:hypothetical protein